MNLPAAFKIRSRTTFIISSVIFFFLFRYLNVVALFFSPSSLDNMTVKHLVLFQFKADVSAEAVKESSLRFFDLKDSCVHPTSQKPYIKTLSGGKDNSKEGLQGGISHAFVLEFESLKDRDYYVDTDPSHQKYKAFIGRHVEKIIVVDYVEGQF
ncbi:uncharacterized protein F4822DRAFT_425630 [Hypoxylon trugodes]|uniref:uncharacterized protein n=1 Tax=Hypoxylon trugodes TaxID=326681 RepID=UPI002193702B|nr:uncharacterized protein F4822DRAFT_425630 [Hypoxylon trugodes]KAI1392420.1 hypothetical protein F4822DRAFT_425630 [Hypoxylon trugodes]